MPYKDAEKQKAAKRESERRRRQRVSGRLGMVRVVPRESAEIVEVLEEVPLTARSVLEILAHEIASVRADEQAGRLSKARVIAVLASVALRAIETADFEARLAELEDALQLPAGRGG